MAENISQVFYRNVKNVCAVKKINIGFVERRCALPLGYISRWRKKGMPLLDAKNIAGEIGVSVDILMNDRLTLNDIKEIVKERE